VREMDDDGDRWRLDWTGLDWTGAELFLSTNS
jgi:hypothetical protein